MEHWKKIEGFVSPSYEVSDLGHVRNTGTGRIMDVEIQEGGTRKTVFLSRNKKQQRFYVHRLVYEAFVGEIPEGMFVAHKNGTADIPTNLILTDAHAERRRQGRVESFDWSDTRADEEWRVIRGYPDHRISNQGRVVNTKTMTLLNTTEKGTGGYARVGLTRDGIQRKFLVHRLVYEAFVGAIAPDQVICHENGNGASNVLSNLRADTQRGNLADRLQHETLQHAESHYKSFLSAEQVHEIRLAKGRTVDIARDFGLNYFTVRDIRSGKTWKNLATPGWAPKRKSK